MSQKKINNKGNKEVNKGEKWPQPLKMNDIGL
jgi:hypothetical protein